MFRLFKKKPKEKEPPQLYDIDGEPILENDIVESQRYDLGRCKVVLEGLEFFYQSLDSKQKVSYIKMVDAITENQKVKKVKYEEKN